VRSAEFEPNINQHGHWVRLPPSTKLFPRSLLLVQFAQPHMRLSPRLRDVGQILGGIGFGRIENQARVVSFPVLSHFPDPATVSFSTPPRQPYYHAYSLRNILPAFQRTCKRMSEPNINAGNPRTTWQPQPRYGNPNDK